MVDGIQVTGINAWFGSAHVLRGIDLTMAPKAVTAIIGPSGCGKSTFIRCLNRMHEVVPGATVSGTVLVEGEDVYAPGVDPVQVRRRADLQEAVERALRQAALWDEVKDALDKSGTSLSGGQQQRLCIARALATDPEVLLMDEPASALDPASTARIEDLIFELKRDYTIVIVTHNMQQAARVSEATSFFLMGEMIELGVTRELFTNPRDKRTEDYITGRFG